ncbi:hypothetical protein [uncultured Stenotrophomonas sp.]|uniref:hypothetical protein n=1 Tax=uncultured Stenotrophomonas sp. TaxID=165438 RepID=UPI0028E3BA54|nr:hypothetical protein [uncultured Stenotrophomonas sp.]
MKIKITIGDNQQTALFLDAEHAALAASLLANATVYKRDGYYSTSGWKVAEEGEGVRIDYTEGKDLEPTHPKVAEAQKAMQAAYASKHTTDAKNSELQKQVDALTAQLAGIQSVTTCSVAAPEPEAGTDDVTVELVEGAPLY